MRWISAARRLGSSAIVLALGVAACRRGEAKDGGAFRPLAVGDVAPEYVARTLTGDSVRVSRDEPLTLVNVWATWCESCREEFADLDAMAKDYGPRGLRVLAVSVDQGGTEKVASFVREQGTTFPVAHDRDGRIQQLYRTVGVPSTYLIGRDGRLVWEHTGGLHGAPEEAREVVEGALK